MTSLIETAPINTLFDEDVELRHKFNKYYPDVQIDKIDSDILHDMMLNILDNEMVKHSIHSDDDTKTNEESKSENVIDKNWNKEIVNANIELADALIPEMEFTQSLIHLDGRINEIPIKFMVDTGASMCVTHEYVVNKCCLHHLVDKNSVKMIAGAHSVEPTLGKIWYVEIDLEVLSDDRSIHWISIPVSIDVSHDVKEMEITEEMKKSSYVIEKGLELTKPMSHEEEYDNCPHEHDVILGMTFLRSYRANIDFGTRIMTLNGNIKIPFK
jgi:hypothetical protein